MGGFWIDPWPVWALDGRALGPPEGVAFSRRGDLLALAESDSNRVSVHVCAPETGVPEVRPACVIEGPGSGVDYPHDVDFSPGGRLLVVANRQGPSLTVYARRRGAPGVYGPAPVWTVGGRESDLEYCDGAKFVPPHGRWLAAANLTQSTITFYRRARFRRSRYGPRPCFALRGPETRLVQPDGLAFSDDGALLAAANHGAGTATLYARGRDGSYGPDPLAVLGGTPSLLRFPHSVAFSRDGAHLAVSSAGGRHVFVYGRGSAGQRAWPDVPVLRLEASDPTDYAATNRENQQEGGPKGIAFAGAASRSATHTSACACTASGPRRERPRPRRAPRPCAHEGYRRDAGLRPLLVRKPRAGAGPGPRVRSSSIRRATLVSRETSP